MQFNWTKKNIILTVCSIVLAVILALLAVIFIIKGLKNNIKEQSGSYASVMETLSETPVVSDPNVPEIGLVITSPKSLNTTVTTSKTVISGTSDAKQPLTMNGKEVERSSDGSFSVDVELKVGANQFTFEHKGVKTVCNIKYRYVVIDGYSPSSQEKYPCGSTFVVSVIARVGSSVTATFNGSTINLTQESNIENKEFVGFTGSFTLTDNNDTDINMGKVVFTGKYNGVTEKFYSGNIICLKNETLAGRSYVAEIVAFTAETFHGNTTNDYSDPRNNYLPKGTVDYCDNGLIYDPSSKNTFIKLRCGKRVYVDKLTDDKSSRTTVTTRYKGELPDHNEISVANFDQKGRHTVIKFDTMWKAPFLLDIYPQSYNNPSRQDFSFSSATFQYLDITFCYATVFKGSIDIPVSNPIFSKAEIIPQNGKHTLRLYLKKQGMFYGWDCYYNSDGQLCFEFLNPVNTKLANNSYGVDLTGAKVLIDAGHGGFDPGAVRGNVHEEERNLALAKKIKAELESIGATVLMTRMGDYTVTSDERRLFMKNQRPDYCIAIHHNAASVSSANGFEAFHFNAFSRSAAKMVYDQTMSSNVGLYAKSKFKSHYFFLARITTCPVVLTESGYFTNNSDFDKIINNDINIIKAKAITQGIADYFKSIQYTPVAEPEPIPSKPEITEPEVSSPVPSAPESSLPESSKLDASLPQGSKNEEE